MSKFDRRMRCQHSKETIGLAVIAKNEEDALPTLLGSIQGAFDKIAFVDTGSTDNTVRLFEGWARAEVEAGRLDSYVSDYFEWCDDFSAARNYADNLLDTDWLSWADAEDVIAGAQNLRHVAASDDAVNAWFAEWDYSDRFPRVLRERLVRRGRYTWQGRIHENLNIDEGIEHVVDPSLVRWVHLCDGADDEERYRTRMRILSRWVEEEPDRLGSLAVG